MPSNSKKKANVTIAFPTYEMGPSMETTLASLYAQTAIDRVAEILIVVDGKKMPANLRKKIAHPKLRVISFIPRKGQSTRINDIFANTKTELLILTNDDVLLHVDAVENMLAAFEHTSADFISTTVRPIRPTTFFEHCVNIGSTINEFLFSHWNHARNYLAANGRLLGLRRRLYTKISIPKTIISNDAYMYIFTLLHGFAHQHVAAAIALFQPPMRYKEYQNQSRRFQGSEGQLQPYFDKDISAFFMPPKGAGLIALLHSLLCSPFYTICYLGLFLRSRLESKALASEKWGYWKTDRSTKQLSSRPLQ